ncbi:MAG: helix-turn-helix domain-containing protein, partial [Capsulimonadales bacterium]|nr:helix-turn-helix domain-containing protein [Capsulimonadales bacterium]
MKTGSDWQTERRLRAVELYQKGWQQKLIAEALGVTKGAISQWIKRAKDLPPEEQRHALTVKKSPGRPPKVTEQHRKRLTQLVDQGPAAFGFVGDVWTAKRLQTVARQKMDLRVSVATIKNILRQEGYSVQKPQV